MSRKIYVLAAVMAVSAITATACASASPKVVGPAASSRPSSADPTSVAAPVAAPTCPARYGATDSVWVPAPPQGVDGQSQLVPATVPSAAVVCAYLHTDNGALTGSHQLTGSLAAIPATLSSAPAEADSTRLACPLYFRAVDADNYLIGLGYPGGQLWVSAPRFHCGSSGNGAFTSSANFGEAANAWYVADAATLANPSASPSATQS